MFGLDVIRNPVWTLHCVETLHHIINVDNEAIGAPEIERGGFWHNIERDDKP